MTEDTQSLARQILEIGPLMMRTLSAELRQGERVQDSAHFRLMWMLEHRSASLSELAERQMVSLPTMSNSITTMLMFSPLANGVLVVRSSVSGSNAPCSPCASKLPFAQSHESVCTFRALSCCAKGHAIVAAVAYQANHF